MKRDIKSMTASEIGDFISSIGEKSFRSGQIYSWLAKGAESFSDMKNVPKPLRDKLDESFYIYVPKAIGKQESGIDGTVKYLWQLRDGNTVESVLMRYDYGNTICISSQVGCSMGCKFCASTIGGLVRNLEPSEMLDQVMCTQKDSGLKISNIVMMGIGEPLDNFNNVIRFLELANDPEGVGIGMRHITLSTCGLADWIDKLGDYTLQLTLSVSLHAPDDKTRSLIMPVNRRYCVDDVMVACKRYFDKTGRRITFEYAMIDGINDTAYHAQLLADRVIPVGGHVNLIPLNHVQGRDLQPSTQENMNSFVKLLVKRGVNVTVRRRLGSDIDASCGQLRRNNWVMQQDGGNL